LVAFGIVLEKRKKYHVEFEASADKSLNLNMGLGKSSSPYTSYFWQSFSVTSASKKYSYEFTMSQSTDSISRIVFNLGLATGTVNIDNVLVYEVKPSGFGQILNLNQIKIYPIPAKNYFTIELPGLDSFIIFDNSGKVILEQKGLNHNNYKVDCSSMPKGIYLLKTYEKLGTCGYSKILIE